MDRITVIGSANVDFVIHSDRIPKLGETLVGKNFQIGAGGKGLNQAVAIAKLGGTVSFLGAVGQDANGEILLNTLEENHVPFIGIKDEIATTGCAIITVINGDNFILLNPGANALLSPEMIEANKDFIIQSDFCVLQLEIPTETVLKVCKIAHENNTKVVLNIAPYKTLPKELYSMVDYLIPNEHEAEALTGICVDSEENARKAIQSILELGVKNAVITLGDKGCVYNIGKEIFFHPAIKVKAVDTTSAGDCFIGALITKLSEKQPLPAAIAFATKASAIAVSREGASKSIPFANEVI